jgi:hypothetical protein
MVSCMFLIWTWSLHPSWEIVNIEWITVNSDMKILWLQIHCKRMYVSRFNVHKFYFDHVTKQPTRAERPEPTDPRWPSQCKTPHHQDKAPVTVLWTTCFVYFCTRRRQWMSKPCADNRSFQNIGLIQGTSFLVSIQIWLKVKNPVYFFKYVFLCYILHVYPGFLEL